MRRFLQIAARVAPVEKAQKGALAVRPVGGRAPPGEATTLATSSAGTPTPASRRIDDLNIAIPRWSAAPILKAASAPARSFR
jgi:hypothetical protein